MKETMERVEEETAPITPVGDETDGLLTLNEGDVITNITSSFAELAELSSSPDDPPSLGEVTSTPTKRSKIIRICSAIISSIISICLLGLIFKSILTSDKIHPLQNALFLTTNDSGNENGSVNASHQFYKLRMSLAENEEYDARLRSPFTAMVSGPSGSGKTHLMKNLINQSQDVADPPPHEIIYCYGEWQSTYEHMKGLVRFNEGMIDVKAEIPRDGKNRWIIVDDLMQELAGKNETDALFTKYSHHMNLSVFYLVQNLFVKENRTISLNTHYFFLFKNPRDAGAVSRLAMQSFPKQVNGVTEAFKDATTEKHSYLLIDLKQETPEERRLIGNFASETIDMTMYVLK